MGALHYLFHLNEREDLHPVEFLDSYLRRIGSDSRNRQTQVRKARGPHPFDVNRVEQMRLNNQRRFGELGTGARVGFRYLADAEGEVRELEGTLEYIGSTSVQAKVGDQSVEMPQELIWTDSIAKRDEPAGHALSRPEPASPLRKQSGAAAEPALPEKSRTKNFEELLKWYDEAIRKLADSVSGDPRWRKVDDSWFLRVQSSSIADPFAKSLVGKEVAGVSTGLDWLSGSRGKIRFVARDGQSLRATIVRADGREEPVLLGEGFYIRDFEPLP